MEKSPVRLCDLCELPLDQRGPDLFITDEPHLMGVYEQQQLVATVHYHCMYDWLVEHSPYSLKPIK